MKDDCMKQNRFLQILPPRLSFKELLQRITIIPKFKKASLKKMAIQDRLDLLEELWYAYREPLAIHKHLYNKVYDVLSVGYKSRPPELFIATINRIRGLKEDLRNKKIVGKKLPNPPGFSFIGVSGMGKSTAMDDVLALFPKILFHEDLNVRQISSVKVSCPPKGSTKALCKNILREVDQLIGTSYYEQNKIRTVEDDLLIAVSDVVAVHAIGVIVIDEVQNLRGGRKEVKEKTLDFVKALSSTTGVPVIYVGTPAALRVLSANLEVARRTKGIGWLVFERFKFETEKWGTLIEGIWNVQVLTKPGPLTADVSSVYYDECQGITELLVTLHINVQKWCLERKAETITAELIREVAAVEMGPVQPMIQALRSNDPSRIAEFPDIDESWLDRFQILASDEKEPEIDIDQDKLLKLLRMVRRPHKISQGKFEDIARSTLHDWADLDLRNVVKKFRDAVEVIQRTRTKAPKRKPPVGVLIELAQAAPEGNVYAAFKEKGFIPNLMDIVRL